MDLLISDGHVRKHVILRYSHRLKDTGLALLHDIDIQKFRQMWAPEDHESANFFYYFSCRGTKDFFRGNSFVAFSRSQVVISNFERDYLRMRRLLDRWRNPSTEVEHGSITLPGLGPLRPRQHT